jgi:hypothetical protein
MIWYLLEKSKGNKYLQRIGEMMEEFNPWTYNGKIFRDDDIGKHKGFVYRLTSLDGKMYIGCKRFYSKTVERKTVKNQDTKRKKTTKISDYQRYYSSSKAVKAIIQDNDKGWFRREILSLHLTIAEMLYEEARLLFQEDVLNKKEPDGSFVYLNENIDLKHYRKTAKIQFFDN